MGAPEHPNAAPSARFNPIGLKRQTLSIKEEIMSINLSIPQQTTQELRPRITVVGVGGGGCNAVNNMIDASLDGVDFLVANTDGQSLAHSKADRKVQLGSQLTGGLGAGSKPEIGRLAAEESLDDIMAELADCNMVFITAGMGGGTGTGAAPVIAKAARDRGILTVGVVTKPFQFEGKRRMEQADDGVQSLQDVVDTLIVIPNQNLFSRANEQTRLADAFSMADTVLHQGVCGVTDLMIKPGLINLDFADIRAVMLEMGKAMMGTGEASGENRAIAAAEDAINNPLLDHSSMHGAKALLINITGGMDMTLFEVDEAANRIRQEVDEDASIIFGSAFDETMEGVMRISVVATGIDARETGRYQTPERASTAPSLPAMMGARPHAAVQPVMQQTSQPATVSTPQTAETVQDRVQAASQTVQPASPAPIAEAAGTASDSVATDGPASAQAAPAVQPGQTGQLDLEAVARERTAMAAERLGQLREEAEAIDMKAADTLSGQVPAPQSAEAEPKATDKPAAEQASPEGSGPEGAAPEAAVPEAAAPEAAGPAADSPEAEGAEAASIPEAAADKTSAENEKPGLGHAASTIIRRPAYVPAQSQLSSQPDTPAQTASIPQATRPSLINKISSMWQSKDKAETSDASPNPAAEAGREAPVWKRSEAVLPRVEEPAIMDLPKVDMVQTSMPIDNAGPASTSAEDDDDMDIPAFLRRQAN